MENGDNEEDDTHNDDEAKLKIPTSLTEEKRPATEIFK